MSPGPGIVSVDHRKGYRAEIVLTIQFDISSCTRVLTMTDSEENVDVLRSTDLD